jgi:hypothetical protein
MPDDGEGKKQQELAMGSVDPIQAEPALPPVVPPATKTPFQFNQQINIQQIPQKALEKLSPDQLFELSKAVLQQFERSDERHFTHAMEQIKSSAKTQGIAMIVGGLIAVGGVGAVTYLTMQGHQVIAAMLGTFLATVIAVTIGNRFFS